MGKVSVRPQPESEEPERPDQEERRTSISLAHEEFRARARNENHAQSLTEEDDRVLEEHGQQRPPKNREILLTDGSQR